MVLPEKLGPQSSRLPCSRLLTVVLQGWGPGTLAQALSFEIQAEVVMPPKALLGTAQPCWVITAAAPGSA